MPGLNALRRGIPLLSAALLAACDAPQNFMTGGGPGAAELAWLGWFGLITFSVVTVLVWLLLIAITFRRRGSFDEHAPVDDDGAQRWVLIGGIAIPVAILATLFVATLETMGDFPLAGSEMSRDVTVVGRQWWFNARYETGDGQIVHSPTEVHIPTGQVVQLALESRDVIHSFWIPKLHGKVDMIPGETTRLRIKADEPGVYYGQCAEFCGVQHAHMRVQVVAHEPEAFEAWLAKQAERARSPTTAQQKRGQEAFMSAGCPACHTVRGTAAKGRVGPELTHVGSRRRLAGGMFENNPANLGAWITHAQSLKPGARMPDMKAFTGEELRAVVAYLQSLE